MRKRQSLQNPFGVTKSLDGKIYTKYGIVDRLMTTRVRCRTIYFIRARNPTLLVQYGIRKKNLS